MLRVPAIADDVKTAADGSVEADPSRWGGSASAVSYLREHMVPLAILLTLALMFRVRKLDEPLYGDQSLYYYLSRTIGFAPSGLRELDVLWTHVVVRPFMYVFFFPWANIGMKAFQIANILVGASIPCLIYSLNIRFRVQPALAAVVSFAACVHPVLVGFAAKGFPDNLATALMLLGYLAYWNRRLKLSVLALLLTVLAKEAFAMFLLPLAVDGAYRFIKSRDRMIIAPLAGLAAVATTSAVSIFVFSGRLQGWSIGEPEPAFFRAFLISPWFIPLYLLLILDGKTEVFLISLGAPLFYAVWGYWLHRGVEQWYIVGPFAIALIAMAAALQSTVDCLLTETRSLNEGIKAHPAGWGRATLRIRQACAVTLLTFLVVIPEQTGWRMHLGLARVDQLLEAPNSPPDHAKEMALSIDKLNAKALLVVDSFWAFAYYPFGMVATQVASRYTSDAVDQESKTAFLDALRKYDYVVTGDPEKGTAQAKLLRRAFQDCRVHVAGQYVLYRVEPRCLNAMSN